MPASNHKTTTPECNTSSSYFFSDKGNKKNLELLSCRRESGGGRGGTFEWVKQARSGSPNRSEENVFIYSSAEGTHWGSPQKKRREQRKQQQNQAELKRGAAV